MTFSPQTPVLCCGLMSDRWRTLMVGARLVLLAAGVVLIMVGAASGSCTAAHHVARASSTTAGMVAPMGGSTHGSDDADGWCAVGAAAVTVAGIDVATRAGSVIVALAAVLFGLLLGCVASMSRSSRPSRRRVIGPRLLVSLCVFRT